MKYISKELKFSASEKTIFDQEAYGEGPSKGTTWGEMQPSPNPAPEDRLLVEQLKLRIGALPVEHSCPLILHYFGGYGYKEIAKILSMNMNSVGPRISRTLANLSKEIAGKET